MSRNKRFGPTRSELRFRLIFSLCGLAFMGGALIYRGLPQGPASAEILVFGILFFGGTTLWTVRRLLRKDYPDDT